MLSIFSALAVFFKYRPTKTLIDNLGCKFHYRATFLLLMASTLLATSRGFFGEHIRCITANGIPSHPVNTYCFFSSTYTVERLHNKTLLEHKHVIYPGVGQAQPNDSIIYHAYYQWVPFILFGQAIMFYLPHFIWRKCEGKRLQRLAHGLQKIPLTKYNEKKTDITLEGRSVTCAAKVAGQITQIKTYFNCLEQVQINRTFAAKLIGCELLNAINLAVQIYGTHVFLNKQFIWLGSKVMKSGLDGLEHTLAYVFPKVTKCDFYKYGPSGSVQVHDALCVMALNVINEKIFLILWFWYCVMIGITVASMLWRLMTFVLYSRSMVFNKLKFAMACPMRLHTKDLANVLQQVSYSDWLFLCYLAKNLEPYVFQQFLAELAVDYEDKRSGNYSTYFGIGENNKSA